MIIPNLWLFVQIIRFGHYKNHCCLIIMFPPSVQCHKNVLMYFQRLNNLPAGSVLKSVFIESRRLSHLGYRTWYTKANDFAQFYGMDINNAGDASATNQVIRNKIEGHFIADWKYKMQNTAQFPILRTYKLFKQNFKCESYLHLIKNSKYRITFTKFRTSCHHLEVERGRYTNPVTPLECRLCHMR